MQGCMMLFIPVWQLVMLVGLFVGYVDATGDHWSASGNWTTFFVALFLNLLFPLVFGFAKLYELSARGVRAEATRLEALRGTQDENWVPSKDMQDRLARHQWKKRQADEHGHSYPVRESREEQSARSSDWPKPGPLLHPNPENFEELCAAWCRYLGYVDAVKTQNSRDGGIDIKGSGMIAQVKFQVSPVGVRPIRELNGVRELGQEVLFFALNGFTPEARREATQMGFTLIKVAPLEGQIDILA